MKNKFRKFIAGLCLTLLIPVFLGGQLDRPKAREYQPTLKQQELARQARQGVAWLG